LTFKTCTKCHETKPVEDFAKDNRTEGGLQPKCKACNKAYREANRESIIPYLREYHKVNGKDCHKKRVANGYFKKYRQENREAIREYARDYRKKNRGNLWADRNPEKTREINKRWVRGNRHKVNQSSKRYRKNNKAKYTNYAAIRRATKLNATPPWLTPQHHEDMEALYSLALKIGKLTGFVMEVDHIVPLQGENVCGLHVPWNLQLLERSLNRSKSNKHDEKTTLISELDFDV
jgi:hypothetical protein